MNKINWLKVYYWIVSLISVIVITVSISVIIVSILKKILITDEEYLAKYDYRLSQCDFQKEKTDTNCKEEKKKEILVERSYNLKSSIIESVSWLIPFIVLFVFHYRWFKK